MRIIALLESSILLGFVLDMIFADPEKIPHPVVIIGKAISFLERNLRAIFPDTPQWKRRAGGIMAFLIPASTLIITAGTCAAAWIIHPLAFFLIHTLWCWQAIAVRGLGKEAAGVYRCLVPETRIDSARKAVGRIVGRDTESLDRTGVIKAAVETVAENFSDGVMAPMIYMSIGGAPLALTYKSINTMDSMVGYKNERYIDFGRIPAKLDDAAGYIPARLGALIWILAAALMEGRGGQAFRIWKRDRRNHASPNAAQTEAACAGALGVQLAGPAYYFGELYDKKTIGDPERDIVPEDIPKTCRMMYGASVMELILCMAVTWLIW